ncbi:hypothetical protein BC938DRAFT_475626 [Jimgerdemannia flammicorona]|uniref:Ricin B lectin domain-containing protein n=1 Tax=Jimgerdemannia flammicorona TaxID=994334 RepID=A0A433PRM1_9FUNG|nr:hypothetical protein BC938DRAFT_475626 [Jimgerdemannia flammicorona]
MRFLLLSLLSLLATVFLSADAKTFPYASIAEKFIYKSAVKIPAGSYTFRNRATGQYLLFDPYHYGVNAIVPAKGKSNKVSGDTTWKVIYSGGRNYSVHHRALNGNDKCMSTRYMNGIDDAAVIWGCRIDTAKPVLPAKNKIARRRQPHFPTKQTWLFLPVDSKKRTVGPRTYFYFASNAHLYNMVPRCLYPKLTSEGTTALRDCMDDDGKMKLYTDKKLHWELIKRGK